MKNNSSNKKTSLTSVKSVSRQKNIKNQTSKLNVIKNTKDKAELKENKTIPLNKFFNKFIFGSLAFSYGLILLILSIIYNPFTDHGQHIANIVLGSLVVGGAIIFNSIFITLMYRKAQLAICKNLQIFTCIAINCLPIIGIVVAFVFKICEKKENTILNTKLDSNYKKPKTHIASSFTIILFIILVIVMILWILYAVKGPIIDASGKIYEIPGFLNVLLAPIQGFVNAAELVIFLLIMGGFLQVVNETKALEAGVGSLVKKMKGKEIWLIPILMTLFAIGGTTFGMCEETIPFYFIIIPIMLAGGFDLFTGILLILFGAGVGVASSIINPFVINSSIDAISTVKPGIVTMTDGIAWRAIAFVALVMTAITCVTLYARKVKLNPTKSIIYNSRHIAEKDFHFDEKTVPILTRKRKAVLWIFAITFLLMVLSVINWQEITHWDGFDNFNEWLKKYFPFIFNGSGIGSWYLIEMSFLFLTSSLIISMLHWGGESKYLSTFFSGCKDFVSVALIISVARGLAIILLNSGINNLIIGALESVLSGNAQGVMLLLFFVFILLSFLITSTSGFASAVFPTIGPAIYAGNSISVSSSIQAFSFANGLVNIATPTAGIFVAVLGIGKISLPDFYKGSWKMLVTFFVAMVTILLIGTVVKIS